MMRAVLLAALLAAACGRSAASVVIRTSTGPSKYAGGLVRDSTYESNM